MHTSNWLYFGARALGFSASTIFHFLINVCIDLCKFLLLALLGLILFSFTEFLGGVFNLSLFMLSAQ